jgi:antitoxin (DNA-binding transcriptional repressor) of toxin-antitoxin stability system
MRRASIRDLHSRTSELVRAAECGETVVIERRGRAVAELRPTNRKSRRPHRQPPLPDHRDLWDRLPKTTGDSTQYISEDRDR